MKRGTIEHPKMKRLARRLGGRAIAVGTMEMLWHFAGQYAPNGSLETYSAEELADTVYYEGDPEELVDALVTSGWLDRSEELGLVIHDWAEHCEENVHRTLARQVECFVDGTKPKLRSLGRDSAEIKELWEGLSCIEPEYDVTRRNHSGTVTNGSRNQTVWYADTDTKADTKANAIADTKADTKADAKPGGAAFGKSASESAVSPLSGTISDSAKKLDQPTKILLNTLVSRALDFFADDGNQRMDWGRWLYLHWGLFLSAGGPLADVEDLVKRAEDASDAGVRKAKGVGVMHSPNRIIVRDTTKILKSKSIRWREFPTRDTKKQAV